MISFFFVAEVDQPPSRLVLEYEGRILKDLAMLGFITTVFNGNPISFIFYFDFDVLFLVLEAEFIGKSTTECVSAVDLFTVKGFVLFFCGLHFFL